MIDVTVPVQLLSSGAESESVFWQPVQLLHWALKHHGESSVDKYSFWLCRMFNLFLKSIYKNCETIFSSQFLLSVILHRATPMMSNHQSPGTCCVPPPAALKDTALALSPHTTVAAYLQVSTSNITCLQISALSLLLT